MAQQHDDIEERRRRKKRREERRRRQRRQALIARAVILGMLVAILVVIIIIATNIGRKRGSDKSEESSGNVETTVNEGTEELSAESKADEPEAPAVSYAAANADLTTKEGVLDYARLQAAQYDYDGAIATIQSFAGYESDGDLTAEINNITTAKNN